MSILRDNLMYFIREDRNKEFKTVFNQEGTRDVLSLEDYGHFLIQSAKSGNMEIMKLMTERFAAIKWKDGAGNTALHYAYIGKQSLAISLLITAGADVNAVNNDGETPLHKFAASSSIQGAIDLIKKGANINALTLSKVSPLMVACENPHDTQWDLVSELIKRGANVIEQRSNGLYPIEQAILSYNVEAVTELVKSGRELHPDPDFMPLHYAAACGAFEPFKAILDIQPSAIRRVNRDGDTVLHVHCRNPKEKFDTMIMNAAIQAGVNVEHENSMGVVAADYLINRWSTKHRDELEECYREYLAKKTADNVNDDTMRTRKPKSI